jgi:hypothetical protein
MEGPRGPTGHSAFGVRCSMFPPDQNKLFTAIPNTLNGP